LKSCPFRNALEIGIGGPPLPQHRTCGSLSGGSAGRASSNQPGVRCLASADSDSVPSADVPPSFTPTGPAGPDSQGQTIIRAFSRPSLLRSPDLVATPFRSGLPPSSRSTTPSADFCSTVKMNRITLSHVCDMPHISPAKFDRLRRRTAAGLPDLAPVPSIETVFAVTCQLARRRRPHRRFLFIGSRGWGRARVCYTLTDYFFFDRSACGLISGRAMNMRECAVAGVVAVGFCRSITPVDIWLVSCSMNGKVFPSTA